MLDITSIVTMHPNSTIQGGPAISTVSSNQIMFCHAFFLICLTFFWTFINKNCSPCLYHHYLQFCQKSRFQIVFGLYYMYLGRRYFCKFSFSFWLIDRNQLNIHQSITKTKNALHVVNNFFF